MSKRLLLLAPALSLLLALASIAGRRADITLRVNHGTIAYQHGMFAIYSDRVFDGMALFHADWSELAVAFAYAALVLTLLWAISLQLESQALSAAHGCPRCRYDLTDNTSTTCPECGAPIAPDNRH